MPETAAAGAKWNLRLAPKIKEELKTRRQAIIEQFQAGGKPEKLLSDLRASVDAALTQLWQAFGLPSSNAALVAVGGYGRGELFPYSDVDVLILLDGQPSASLQHKLEELVRVFWDIGLEIGHSIRTVEECMTEAAADITVQTSLLEARRVTGSRKLF
ncbi:MAG: nucleotidyltransferase domain-containing protein, partial [Burkholderiaceae bacterium]|nr:nucleotidyltransferase domain-containing protein [Burkholderiaceae bacterium]